MSAEAIAEPTTTTLGPQIDEIYKLRQKKKTLEDQAADIGKLIDSKEQILLAEMDKQGCPRAAGRLAGASVSESVVPQVVDWEALYNYIRRNKAFELLERRPSAPAWREHAERRRDSTVPGTVPFRKRKVSIRTTQ